MLNKLAGCLLFLVTMICPQLGHAASFNCARAFSKTEVAICEDRSASKLDEINAVVFSSLLKLHRNNRDDLLSAQRSFLRGRDRCQDDVECIRNSYVNQIQLLCAKYELPNAACRGLIVDQWQSANGFCRGGSGDDPRTLDWCDVRESIGDILKGLQMCYGKKNQPGYMAEWHRCTIASER
jgi:uncharacterized protein